MTHKKKLVVQLRGGLGNQLFCYAAAKRLAIVNSAELVIDTISGFENDHIYNRTYQLDKFNIKARFATSSERLEPLKYYRRRILIFLDKRRKFENRRLILQEKTEFDKRLLDVTFDKTRYIDGYWQSEKYFRDIESIVREEFTLKETLDSVNQKLLDQILNRNSVAIHFRWFDSPGSNKANNADKKYYVDAIEFIKSRKENTHFFVFSDQPNAVSEVLPLTKKEFTVVDHNNDQNEAHKDLWLMSNCESIIMANSSFSWWAAWLGETDHGLVICPKKKIDHEGRVTTWNFEGQIPERWIKI